MQRSMEGASQRARTSMNKSSQEVNSKKTQKKSVTGKERRHRKMYQMTRGQMIGKTIPKEEQGTANLEGRSADTSQVNGFFNRENKRQINQYMLPCQRIDMVYDHVVHRMKVIAIAEKYGMNYSTVFNTVKA